MTDILVIDDTTYETHIPRNALRRGGARPDPEAVKAIIPGTIVEIRVKPGDRVREGDTLLLLDAMKMHNEVCSPVNGTVRELATARGDRVEKGQLLVKLLRDRQ